MQRSYIRATMCKDSRLKHHMQQCAELVRLDALEFQGMVVRRALRYDSVSRREREHIPEYLRVALEFATRDLE